MANGQFKDVKTAADFAERFLSAYLVPAFGTLSKSEVDHLVFGLMIEAGIVDPHARPFAIAEHLNVTVQKAKALAVTWQVRHATPHTDLEHQLIEQFKRLRFQKDGSYVAVGIGDAVVREYFVSELQNLEIYPDRSFAGEIIRVPLDGFLEFLAKSAQPAAVKAVDAQLVKAGVKSDRSVKGIIKEVVMKAAEKIGERAVGDLAGAAVDHLGSFISGLFTGNSTAAAKATQELFV